MSALVHPSAAADDLQRTSHEGFLFVHLAMSCVALLAAPLFLAFCGVPQGWQTLAFVFLQAPLGASFLLSRSGRLRDAQILVILAVLGMATTLDFGIPGLDPAGLALYTLVPAVAAFTLDIGLIVPAAFAGAIAFVVLGLLQPAPEHAATVSLTAASLIIFPSILYVTGLGVSAARTHNMRTRLERIGATRHEMLSRTLGNLVLRHDRAGTVLSASEEARTLFALAPRDLIGRGLFERIHVADRPLFLKTIADALAGEHTATACLRLRTGQVDMPRSGFQEPVFAWIEFRVRRSLDHSDGLLALVRDVTRARLHEEQLEAARAEAERASVWKDRFLANVSHELRTPLNAIIGFAEMLSNDELTPANPEKRKEYAQIIETSGQHLLSVVNSILDVSKIEAGAFELAPEAFSLPTLADSCCDMIRLKAEREGITILRSYAHGLEDIVADKRSCKQILINLLSNAVKFTPKGGCVGVDIIPEGNSLKIVVADTGIGIAPRDLSQLGQPFFQASANYDRHFEGTGLGLSVVRGLVGLHGGMITVESAPGEGTTICVRLPLDCRNAKPRGEGSSKIEAIVRRPPALPHMRNDNQPVAKIA